MILIDSNYLISKKAKLECLSKSLNKPNNHVSSASDLESAAMMPVKIMPSIVETKVPEIQYPESNDPSFDFEL